MEPENSTITVDRIITLGEGVEIGEEVGLQPKLTKGLKAPHTTPTKIKTEPPKIRVLIDQAEEEVPAEAGVGLIGGEEDEEVPEMLTTTNSRQIKVIAETSVVWINTQLCPLSQT